MGGISIWVGYPAEKRGEIGYGLRMSALCLGIEIELTEFRAYRGRKTVRLYLRVV